MRPPVQSFRAPGLRLRVRFRRAPLVPRLQHQEAARLLALDLVLDAEHRAFGHVGMRRDDFFHAASRKPMAGDVDDVVGPPEDGEIAVGIFESGVGGLVIAREFFEVAFTCARRGEIASEDILGGNGSFTTMEPISPGRRVCTPSSTISTSYPGIGTVGEPR